MNRTGSLLMVVVGVVASAAWAEEPYRVAWSRQIGTSLWDVGYSVGVDAAGNVYVGGDTKGSLGGPCAGGYDIFMCKYDTSGNHQRSWQIGTDVNDRGYVWVNYGGSFYLSGTTAGNLAGPNAGGDDAFLQKYDMSGNLLWASQLGTSEAEGSYSMGVDAQGNGYIAGDTNGNLDGTNAGQRDAYLAKYDSLGNRLWVRQIGTSGNDRCSAVAIDQMGNAYISGYTEGSLGGPNMGQRDIFLAKFDGSGDVLWSTQMGTGGWDLCYSVAVDASGNAYITGSTQGDLGGPSAGGDDMLLAKYDAEGELVWCVQTGTSGWDVGHDLALDTAGNLYVTGWTQGDLGGPNAGSEDAFLAKYDAFGNLLWTSQIGTSSYDYGNSVVVDALGNVFITGETHGSLAGANVGERDAFLVKYEVPEPGSAILLALGALTLIRRRIGRWRG